MKKLILSCLFFISWQTTFIALASVDDNKEPVKIGSYLSPGLIKDDGTGLFNKLNDAILLEMNRKSKLIISSLNRARIGVKKGR